jgi:hypothetical protein
MALALWPQAAAGQCGAFLNPPANLAKISNNLSNATDRLKIQADFVLPTSTFAALNPLANGATVTVVDGDSNVIIDQAIPAGAFDRDAGFGWTSNAVGTHWLFRDINAGSPETSGISHVLIIDENDLQPHQVRVKILGRRGDFPLPPDAALPLQTSVTVDNDTGDCGASAYLTTDCRGHTSPAVSTAGCMQVPPQE